MQTLPDDGYSQWCFKSVLQAYFIANQWQFPNGTQGQCTRRVSQRPETVFVYVALHQCARQLSQAPVTVHKKKKTLQVIGRRFSFQISTLITVTSVIIIS